MAQGSGCAAVSALNVTCRTQIHTLKQDRVFEVRFSRRTVVAHAERRTLLVENADVLDHFPACVSLGAEINGQRESCCSVIDLSFDDGFGVGHQNAFRCDWCCATQCQQNSFVLGRAFGEGSHSDEQFLMLRNRVERELDFLAGKRRVLDDVLFVQEPTEQSTGSRLRRCCVVRDAY